MHRRRRSPEQRRATECSSDLRRARSLCGDVKHEGLDETVGAPLRRMKIPVERFTWVSLGSVHATSRTSRLVVKRHVTPVWPGPPRLPQSFHRLHSSCTRHYDHLSDIPPLSAHVGSSSAKSSRGRPTPRARVIPRVLNGPFDTQVDLALTIREAPPVQGYDGRWERDARTSKMADGT